MDNAVEEVTLAKKIPMDYIARFIANKCKQSNCDNDNVFATYYWILS